MPSAAAHVPLLLSVPCIFTLRFAVVKVFLFVPKSWKLQLLWNKQKYLEWTMVLLKKTLTLDVNVRGRKPVTKVINGKTGKWDSLEKQ